MKEQIATATSSPWPLWQAHEVALGVELGSYLVLATIVSVGVGAVARRFAPRRQLKSTDIWVAPDMAIAVLQLACLLAGMGWALGAWLMELTLGSLVVGLAVSAALVFCLRGLIEQVLCGVALMVRGRVRVGDPITVGTDSGTLTGLTLTQIELRGVDGSVSLISHCRVQSQTIRVGRIEAENTLTAVMAGQSPSETRQLQEAAHLCPYRRAGSEVGLRRDLSRCEISLHTWAVGDLANAQLRFERWLAAPAAQTPRGRWLEDELDSEVSISVSVKADASR